MNNKNNSDYCILVVDDDPDVRVTICKTLNASGFAYIEASTLEEAIAALKDGPAISLVLLDFWLGDVLGLDLLEPLRERHPETPVLFMSGGGGDLPLQTVTALTELRGSEDFLYKPYTRKELLNRIQRLLNLSQ